MRHSVRTTTKHGADGNAAAPPCIPSRSPAEADLLLQADVVLPIEADPVADGCIWISGGVIKAVGSQEQLRTHLPPGLKRSRLKGAILPGFINTHAHLELSSMQGRIPRPASRSEDFTGWIRHVLDIRETWGPREFDESVRFGTRQLLEAGTTTIGDVTASGFSLTPLIESGLRSVIFREVLGFGAEREERAHQVCEDWLDKWQETSRASSGRVRLGLSPHAPHSTSPSIYKDCISLARQSGCLLSTHISETLEEIELTRTGEGPFRALLAFRGLPIDEWKVPGVSPTRYLHDLGLGEMDGLAIHLNYLLPGDLDILRTSRLTPVYCPQSHIFLGHHDHPAAIFKEHGIPMAVGTDSLASNDNLEMLEEIRLLYRLFPQIPTSHWFECCTIVGARALGVGDQLGGLAPGKLADLCVVQFDPSEDTDDPYLRLVKSGHNTATMIHGEWIYKADGFLS